MTVAKVCSFRGCERRTESKGLCATHAAQMRRRGVLQPIRPRYPTTATCAYQGCGRRIEKNGLCSGHASQLRSGRQLQPIQTARRHQNGLGTVCRFAGCERRRVAYGLCDSHRAQQRKGQPLRPIRHYEKSQQCAAFDCDRPVVARNLCSGHYQQACSGRPLAPLVVRRRPGSSSIRDPLGRAECGACRKWMTLDQFYVQQIGIICRDCFLERSRARRHRVSVQVLRVLYEQGSEACWSCHTSLPLASLQVDHDHSCCAGETSCGNCINGLLCATCNTMSGFSRDDPGLLLAGAAYLLEVSPEENMGATAIAVRHLQQLIRQRVANTRCSDRKLAS